MRETKRFNFISACIIWNASQALAYLALHNNFLWTIHVALDDSSLLGYFENGSHQAWGSNLQRQCWIQIRENKWYNFIFACIYTVHLLKIIWRPRFSLALNVSLGNSWCFGLFMWSSLDRFLIKSSIYKGSEQLWKLLRNSICGLTFL